MKICRIILTIIGCFLFAGGLQAARLRIMTWDIEDAYPPEKIPVLAKVVRKHDIDILALQNVQTEKDRVNDAIQLELDKIFGKGVFRHQSTTGQRFDDNVIFWNSKTVRMMEATEDKTLRMKSHRQRPAQIFKGKAGAFDFYLVNVNLYQGIAEDDGLKLKQAGLLRDLLKKIAGKNNAGNVILAGNLNMSFPDEKVYDEVLDEVETNANPAFNELNTDHFLSFCTREIIQKDQRAFSYIGDVLEGGRLIDHIAANTGAWKHYLKGSARVVRVDKEYYDDLDDYEWNFSDHLPVMAVFETE